MDGDDVAQDRQDDAARLARFLLHRDLEQTATVLRQLLSTAAAGSTDEQQAKSAPQVVARAGRTLDEMIGHRHHEHTRQPTRVAPLIEQVAATHDPERRRIACTVPSIVANLDYLGGDPCLWVGVPPRRADAQHDPHPFQLTTEQGFGLLDDIAAFGAPSPMIVLTGGDPFEREDLAELVAYGSVTPRATPERLAEMARAGAKAVSISLDGAPSATHDGFRGIEGVYDATLETCRTVTGLGMHLQINTTITASNLVELPDILRRVIDLDAFLWSVFLLVPTGRGGELEQLTPDVVEDVLHCWWTSVATSRSRPPRRPTSVGPSCSVEVAMARIQRPCSVSVRPTGGCAAGSTNRSPSATRTPRPPLDINAGRGFVFIDHVGAVYPSGFLPIPVGSVKETPLPEIYRDAPLLRSLRDPSLLHGRCGRCEFRAVCGGSRSRAYAVTGDPLGEEPDCVYEPDGASLVDASSFG